MQPGRQPYCHPPLTPHLDPTSQVVDILIIAYRGGTEQTLDFLRRLIFLDFDLSMPKFMNVDFVRILSFVTAFISDPTSAVTTAFLTIMLRLMAMTDFSSFDVDYFAEGVCTNPAPLSSSSKQVDVDLA